MKTIILSLACAVFATSVIAADVVTEKTTTTTTTTTSTGTLEEYTPGTTFVVKEEAGPVKYRYGKKVTYVTKGGKVLTDADVKTRVRVGSPVTVHYGSEGDTRIINRVEIDD
jgi:hypothetical protein